MTNPKPVDAAELAEIEAEHLETSDGYCRRCDNKGGWVQWPCLPARLVAELRQARAEIKRLRRDSKGRINIKGGIYGTYYLDGSCCGCGETACAHIFKPR